jgi:hypothetical protein
MNIGMEVCVIFNTYIHIYPSILNTCQGHSLPESKEEPVKGFNVVNEGDDDDHSVDGFADSPGPHHIHICFDHTYTLHNRFTFFPRYFYYYIGVSSKSVKHSRVRPHKFCNVQ